MWSCQNSTVESGLLNSLSIARPITKKVFSKKNVGEEKRKTHGHKNTLFTCHLSLTVTVSLSAWPRRKSIAWPMRINTCHTFNVLHEPGKSQQLVKSKQMHAILLLPTGIAIPPALKVTYAFVLPAYGSIGWFAEDTQSSTSARKFLAKDNTIQTDMKTKAEYGNVDASDVRLMTRNKVGPRIDKDREVSGADWPRLTPKQSAMPFITVFTG